MPRSTILGLIALALGACAAVPTDYSLSEASGEALVLLEVEPTEALREGGEITFDIARYLPEQGVLSYSFSGGWAATNEVKNRPGARQFVLARTKVGGDHVVVALVHKHAWVACLNGGTHQFAARQGAVTFVGRVDPEPALAALALGTSSFSRNGERHYLFDIPRLPLTPPSELPGWEQAAQAYLRENFPGVRAPLQAATPRPAAFPPGRGWLGDRVCR